MTARRPRIDEVVALLGLEPLPVEGGLFAQTWRSATADDVVVGTAIMAAFTGEPGSFSAMHRLPADEIWHFYLGDPMELLLLHPDGSVTRPRLGHDVLGGEVVQLVVRAGTWMGGRVRHGGEWALIGTTMAPGFHSAMYEGGRVDDLVAGWPAASAEIVALVRPDEPTSMPPGL